MPADQVRSLRLMSCSFGMKGALYREDALVVWAAKDCNSRIFDGTERIFLSDEHARAVSVTPVLGLDADGLFTDWVEAKTDTGAYLSRRTKSMLNIGGVAGHAVNTSYRQRVDVFLYQYNANFALSWVWPTRSDLHH